MMAKRAKQPYPEIYCDLTSPHGSVEVERPESGRLQTTAPYAIPLFVPAEPIGELPSYHVWMIFLDVVIAWPHVVCLYIL